MFRRPTAFLRRQDPARLAIAAALIGFVLWVVMFPMPDAGAWFVPNLLLNLGVSLCKCIGLVAFFAALARALIAYREERKLLLLGAIWCVAMFVLITALAAGRQTLVQFTAKDPSIRYIPASGNKPDVGLWAVTWPPTGWGAHWMSDDYKSPLLKLYPRMWKSGRIYCRELIVALVMVAAWIAVGRLGKSKSAVMGLLILSTIVVLVFAQLVNRFLILDYDTFFMGVWSDSLLFDLFLASVLPSTATAVTFAFVFVLGAGSVLAMRLLCRQAAEGARLCDQTT